VKYVWIVEIKEEDDDWAPTIGCALTKRDALHVELPDWKWRNPNDKFRVRRYEAVK